MSKTAKAAVMQQESYALAQTKSEFAKLLRTRGIASEDKTLTYVELAKVEAEYVLQGVNNPNLTIDELIDEAAKYSVGCLLSPSNAYDVEVTDELLRLYGLSDEYSFQPPTNKPQSYVDPDDNSKEYILTEAQREKYVEISHATYNDAVLTIITDPSYARLTDAQKAERLNAMRDKLSDVVRNEFLYRLSLNTTFTDREEDKVSAETRAYIRNLLDW